MSTTSTLKIRCSCHYGVGGRCCVVVIHHVATHPDGGCRLLRSREKQLNHTHAQPHYIQYTCSVFQRLLWCLFYHSLRLAKRPTRGWRAFAELGFVRRLYLWTPSLELKKPTYIFTISREVKVRPAERHVRCGTGAKPVASDRCGRRPCAMKYPTPPSTISLHQILGKYTGRTFQVDRNAARRRELRPKHTRLKIKYHRSQ